MNLIDRNALYEKLENAKWESDFNNGHAPWNLGARVQTIANMPTIDAVPVVHGEWAKSEYNGFLKCSVCNDCYVDAEWVSDGKWGFCPHCGADLRGKPNEL